MNETRTCGRRPRIAKSIASSGLLITILISCACTQVDFDPRRLRPPELNPHPTKFVKVRVVAPATLEIRLEEMWNANSHPFFSSGACDVDREKPGSSKDVLFVPVALKWDGTSYGGSFVADRYLPSRCDWSFGGLTSSSPSKDTPVIYSDSADKAYPENNASDRTADIWCGIDPAPQQPRAIVCTDLSYFAMYSDHFPAAWVSSVAVAKGKGPESILFITPNARSVELHYHDFEAEARATVGTGQKTTGRGNGRTTATE